MNIKQAAEFLEQEGIRVKATAESIYVALEMQDENIYKLEKRGDQWVYVFVEYERNSSGKESELKVFQDEAEAANYYFLATLQSHYYNKYIFPYREQNPENQIGTPACTLNHLKNALRSLPAKQANYRFFEEDPVPHSIHIKRANPTECMVQYIGSKNQIAVETIALEDWVAYSAMFDFVYLLSLLDQKSKESGISLTDEDYATFITA